VLYDGACGVCSRWVPFWTPTLLKLGLHTAPLQSPWVAERSGLSPEVLLKDIRLLHQDGSLTSGPEVYRYVSKRVWWLFPVYLLSVTPLLRQLFDWSYRTFARHRMRVSEVCRLG